MTLDQIAPHLAMFIRPLRLVSSGWTGHVPFGAWLTAMQTPRVLVELGSHFGMSYAAFCQTVRDANLNTKCYAVDTWQGDEHAGFYGDEVYNDLVAFNQQHFADFSQLLRMTFDEATTHFEDGSVDLLHIDGLHTYDAVKHDFESWLPKLSDRAIVLFHDTCIRDRGFGVWKYWAELTQKYPSSFEFDHSAGLGVLAVGDHQPEEVRRLFDLRSNPAGTQVVKDVFDALGESVLRRWELESTRGELTSRNDDVQRVLAQLANVERELGVQQDAHRHAAALLEAHDKKLQDTQRLLAASEHDRAASERDRAEIQARNESLASEISRLQNSLSWRITQPLRHVRGAFKSSNTK